MSAIVETLYAGLTWLYDGLLGIATAFWDGLVALLGGLGPLFAAVGVEIVAVSVEVVGFVIVSALNLLPQLDPANPTVSLEALAGANQYVPLDVAAGLAVVWMGIFAYIGTWKLVKFIRGGG